jgi:hypothetical protein
MPWRHAPGAVVGALRKPLVSMAVGLLVGVGAAAGTAAALWPEGAQLSRGSVAVHEPGVTRNGSAESARKRKAA